MRPAANLELRALVAELQPIVGSRFQKAYQADSVLRIKLHKPGRGAVDLLIEPGVRLHITKFIEEVSAEPTQFIKSLRKALANAALGAIEQHNFDRIIVFTFAKEKRFYLIAEMFAKGNLILADQDWTILHPLHSETWKDRTIAPRAQYKFPESRGADPFGLNSGQLRALLDGKPLAACLATKLNLGALYVEESIARAGLDPKSKADGLTDAQVGALLMALDSIDRDGQNPAPVLYKDGWALFPLKGLGTPIKRAATISAALDELAAAAPAPEAVQFRAKLEHQLAEQQAVVGQYEAAAAEAKVAGDAIYAQLTKVEEILRGARTMQKAGASAAQIEAELGVKYDSKTAKIRLSL